MPRLVVVSGPPNTAKLARAWEISAADRELRLLHRDQLRVLLGRLIDESHLTLLLGAMAANLLANGYGVITAGQNLAPSDLQMWQEVAAKADVELEWIRT